MTANRAEEIADSFLELQAFDKQLAILSPNIKNVWTKIMVAIIEGKKECIINTAPASVKTALEAKGFSISFRKNEEGNSVYKISWNKKSKNIADKNRNKERKDS